MASSASKPATSSARTRFDLWCERGILALVLVILLFGPLAIGAVRLSEFVVIEALTLGVLVLWLARLWGSRSHRLLWPPICWGVLAVVGYVLVRGQFVGVEYLARQEMIRVLIYGLLFLAVLNNLHRQESTRIISLCLLGLATLISLYAVYQWVTVSRFIWRIPQPATYYGRASGTYVCPNHLAGFLEMLIPLALAYTLLGRFKAIPRVLIGYACLVMLAGMAVTISRGGWVSLLAALLLFFGLVLRRPGYRLIGLGCLLLLGVGAFGFLKWSGTVERRVAQTTFHTEGYFQNDRLRYWLAAYQMWQDGHVWYGVGPGQYTEHYRKYRQESEFSQARPHFAHNDYLNLLADYGVVGALIVLWPWLALGLGVVQTWRFVRRRPNDLGAKNSNKAAFVLGAALGLGALLIQSVTDFNLHIPANAILAVVLMALLSGHLRFASERWWFTPRWAAKLVLTLLLGWALLYLGQQTWRTAREQRALRAAKPLPLTSPERLAALRRAWAAEPMNPDTVYAIAEALRHRSFDAPLDWKPLAEEALLWLERGAALNPLDPYFLGRRGMCLDWLDRPAEALACFQQALALDPNHYYVRALLGWHFFQTGEFPLALSWFEKSLALNWRTNPLADTYLALTRQRLAPGPAPPAK